MPFSPLKSTTGSKADNNNGDESSFAMWHWHESPIGMSAITTLIAAVGGRTIPSSNHCVGVRAPIGRSATTMLVAAVGGRIAPSSDGGLEVVAPVGGSATTMLFLL
jgi:hypothetical protein